MTSALNISDVIVFGKTQVFRNFAEVNLTLNKSVSLTKEHHIFWFCVLRARNFPDPKKVEAIRNAKPPTMTSDMRSFLGMATYCAKFNPNFSDTSELL